MAAKVKVVEEQFRVPTMAECDDEFRALMERHQKVHAELGENRRAQNELEADMKKTPPVRAVRAGLADVLGDTIEVDGRPAKLAELRKRAHDLEDGIAILFKRMHDRKSAASVKVCEAVRAEFGSRVKALAAALEAAHAARRHFESLVVDLENEDVTWQSRLGVDRPGWMGDIQDGHVQRFIRTAKENGYV
ncbi:hypothetical protein RLW55_16935 [Hyphomicrobium sp. B1]|uniref:hypothetical protein n=1 Tax=Hyphomicrobium sp. B1 TaxID=3075651 RepID=UPI003C3034A0